MINLILTKSKVNENKFMCKIKVNHLGIQKIITLKKYSHVMYEKCFNLTCKKMKNVIYVILNFHKMKL